MRLGVFFVVNGLIAACFAEQTTMHLIPQEVAGRKVDAYWHYGEPAKGDDPSHRNLVLVQHPKPGWDVKGRPLYVVLHSAGHDALMALQCTERKGDHDIYRSPDDFYGLYLDCRTYWDRENWWGACTKNDEGETTAEKRVVETVRWAVDQYAIDANRVYLCGNSMGGSGALGIGLAHGDIFAAVKANVPAVRLYRHPFKALGSSGHWTPDPPVVVDYSAPDDEWSDAHADLIALMRERQVPYQLYWGAFGHANDDARMLAENDIIHSFDWLSIRKNEPYPVFLDASSDDPSPWPSDRMSRVPGQINGFTRWSDVLEDDKKVEMILRVVSAAELDSKMFKPPKSVQVDVVVRRLTRFRPSSDCGLAWRMGGQSGTTVADKAGVILIPRLTIGNSPEVLSVRRADRVCSEKLR